MYTAMLEVTSKRLSASFPSMQRQSFCCNFIKSYNRRVVFRAEHLVGPLQ